VVVVAHEPRPLVPLSACIAGFEEAKVLTFIWPQTLVRWHRAGFRCYWRWKSRTRGGRPQIEPELRVLIRRMNVEKPLWGAPRIHDELLKLGSPVGFVRCLDDHEPRLGSDCSFNRSKIEIKRGRLQLDLARQSIGGQQHRLSN